MVEYQEQQGGGEHGDYIRLNLRDQEGDVLMYDVFPNHHTTPHYIILSLASSSRGR